MASQRISDAQLALIGHTRQAAQPANLFDRRTINALLNKELIETFIDRSTGLEMVHITDLCRRMLESPYYGYAERTIKESMTLYPLRETSPTADLDLVISTTPLYPPFGEYR